MATNNYLRVLRPRLETVTGGLLARSHYVFFDNRDLKSVADAIDEARKVAGPRGRIIAYRGQVRRVGDTESYYVGSTSSFGVELGYPVDGLVGHCPPRGAES